MSREDTIDYTTIEKDDYSGDWFVYGWGTYGSNSVLEGQQRRVFLDAFKTREEAEIKYPNADPLDLPSTPPHPPMPETPPDWFDPADAGEVWHEDDF
jgi:hypothetical protein